MTLARAKMDNQVRKVRVVVDGSTKAGRDILRGVIFYARAHTRWRLAVDMIAGTECGQDWADDDATIYATHYSDPLQDILARGKPVVGTLAHHEDAGIPTVRCDDTAVGELAADHLLERGFEEFIFCAGGDGSKAAWLRWEGFAGRIRQRGFSARSCDLPQLGKVETTYVDQLQALLPELRKPLAMLVDHDGVGRDVIDLIAALGFSVPEQVAVLGVDNDELHCETCVPPMSSIAIPYAQIGRHAAATLNAIINNEPLPELRLIPPNQVITRQSTDVIAIAEPRLAEAMRFIREHACDPCGVEDVVRHTLVSRRWLERQFLLSFGRTPRDEIVRVRIERAKYLLRDSNLSMDTVANRSGYKQVQNMICAFRKTVGQTPAVYRRNVLGYSGNTVSVVAR